MPDPVVQLLRGASEYSFTLMEALCGLWRPAAPAAASPDSVALKGRAQQTLWRLQSEYQRVAGDPRSLDNLILLADLLPSADDFRDAAVAWLDLVETLVQTAEREYGAAPGKGAYKAEQVEGDPARAADRSEVEHPQSSGVSRTDRRGERGELDDRLGRPGAQSQQDLGHQCGGSHEPAALHPGPALPPAGAPPVLRVGADRPSQSLAPALRQAGGARRPSAHAGPARGRRGDQARAFPRRGRGGQRAAKIAAWVVVHRQQVVALVELVSFATQEAEAFARFTGPQKKEYARDIVVAFLEELKIVDEDSLWEAMVERFIDWGIDGIVQVFNKRKLFQHRSMTSAA